MSHVDLDSVKTGLFRSSAGLAEIVDEISDVFLAHLLRHNFKGRLINGRRGKRGASADFRRCLASGMGKLKENTRWILVDGFCDTTQAIDQFVLVNACLVRACNS